MDDKARLDWLAKNKVSLSAPFGEFRTWVVHHPKVYKPKRDIRKAIDAAIRDCQKHR